MSERGLYTTVDGRPAVRFERRLPHPVEAVWRALTDPSELEHWFPHPIAIEALRLGAVVRIDDPRGILHSEIAELEPARRLAFRWGTDLLRFELAPADGGTLLTMTQVLEGEGERAAAKMAAGWHLCLDALARCLDGAPVAAGPCGVTPQWRVEYDAYVADGLPSGADVSGLSERPRRRAAPAARARR